jgi:hypothetical protein
LSADEDIAKFAAKRYQLYLKEDKEEKKKEERYSEWIQYIITSILWLIKLITNSLEKVNIKKRRVIEKIPVE